MSHKLQNTLNSKHQKSSFQLTDTKNESQGSSKRIQSDLVSYEEFKKNAIRKSNQTLKIWR